jgi:hypothetical protein
MACRVSGACRAAAALAGLAIASPQAQAGEARDYYPEKVWGDPSGGKMNASSFTFRDLNRNGLYDTGDRPMAKIAVVMSSSGSPPLLHRTNIAGFANFVMSVSLPSREIAKPGRYAFEVVPPPGWAITTGNGTQDFDVETLPGSPGDLVVSEFPTPVGLAPDLSISGKVGPGSGTSAITITATGPEGRTAPIEVGADGRFEIAATPGVWTVAAGGAETTVEVGAMPVVLPAIAPHPEGGTAASAVETIDFDQLVDGEALRKIPSGYAGLNWQNLVATHSRYYQGEGYINGVTSGDYVAYNGSGHPVSISSAEPFDFLGASFALAWLRAEGETLRIRAWRGGELLHEDQVALSAMGPVYFAAGYRGIDRLELSTEHYWQFVTDDMRIARD